MVDSALKNSRLDLNSLKTMLRQKNIFSLSDVEYAIFETNGKLSVMSQEPKQPLTKTDMNPANLKQKIYPIAMEVISDGKVLTENLAKLHLDDQWLVQQIQNQK